MLAAGYTICLQLNSLHSMLCYSMPGCFLLSNGRNSSSSADGCPFLQCHEEVQFGLSHFVPANNCSSSSLLFPLAVAAVWCHLESALSSFTLLIFSDGMFSPGHTLCALSQQAFEVLMQCLSLKCITCLEWHVSTSKLAFQTNHEENVSTSREKKDYCE